MENQIKIKPAGSQTLAVCQCFYIFRGILHSGAIFFDLFIFVYILAIKHVYTLNFILYLNVLSTSCNRIFLLALANLSALV